MDLKEIVRYFSAVTPHSNGEEISANIETHMRLSESTRILMELCQNEFSSTAMELVMAKSNTSTSRKL
jgi:hypothetical protein